MAVLYFDNLSRDTADAYLSDGLTEEIIIRLGQVPRLSVKSRFEVLRLKGHASVQDPVMLGRSLNAAYLVTGSIQRAGDRVRLRVALVRAATREQVWGDVIDRASRDLFTVESEIAAQVTTAITGRMLPAERTRLARPVTSNPDAYDAYLRGLRLMNESYDERSIREALVKFDLAATLDTGFAAALGGRAMAWVWLADGFVPGREAFEHAREAAEAALAHDSSASLAWANLAIAVLSLDLDAVRAERLARRAVAEDPRSGYARFALSQALYVAGRVDESIAEGLRGWERDSTLSAVSTWYGTVLVAANQLDSADAFIPRLRPVSSPEDVAVVEGALLAARGDFRRARAVLDWKHYGGMAGGTYVRALVGLGDSAAARATVDSMVSVREHGYYNPMAIARGYAQLGDIERGIAWLQRAVAERTEWAVLHLRRDPEIASLRSDPRYAALVRQLRF